MADFDDNDIAIIGMAIRVPGASTPEEYWANLIGGVESLRSYTDEELTARGVSPTTLADPNYIKKGMTLQNLDQFDPEFFGFSPKEAAILDPQHRQFYEVAWEALERAGHPPKAFDGNIGVFAGCGMGAYFAFNLLSNPDLVDSVGLFLLRHTGNDKDFLATRVSYSFDLKGPSVNVQTACSTSLVATHMAVQSLLARESDLALAGGVTIELPHALGYHYKEGEILSPDGHCRTFDHRSKGTIFGSGVGVVVLRRLSDAIAAGDHIHAVIKGSAVNNDGSTKVGYLAPSVDGQAAAIAEALAIANVGADTVTYVECHGTATPVGDPIEIAALTQAFRESSDEVGYCRVGSVKTNIGHLDTAAGVASLIKASLALEHRQIPPSLNFEAPNPAIDFDGSPFVVAAKLTEWERKGAAPRRAGVNSLGVGGTNAFVVLQEPPAVAARARDEAAYPLVLSARNKRSLDDAGARLAKWLRAHPEQSLADVAYTLLEGRHGFEHRRVLGAKTHEEAAALLENGDARRVFNHTLELDQPSVVFMYPGGGAQYFQMSRGLYANEPVYREHIDRGLDILKTRFGANLTSVFFAEESQRDDAVAKLAKPSVQLPLIFLVEYSLTRLWQHYGVQPAAIVGHSLGENTAACIAGVISFEDALGLVLLRGQLMDEVPEGAMLSVSLPARDLVPLLGDLDLAAANSPQLSVASGPAVLIDQLAAKLTGQGIESQRVRINIAAHSRLLDGILGRFRQYLKSIKLNEPTLPIISNRTGKWLDPARARDPEYWVEHLRNTVMFADGIASLLESPDRVFIEVGPGNTLGSFARQGPQAPTQRVFASLRHHQDPVPDDVYFKAVVARLWAVGVQIDKEKLWPATPRRVPLPSYAFQHASYWIAPGVGHATASKDDIYPRRLEDADAWFRAPRWVQQGILEIDETPRTWLVFRGNEPVADAIVKRLRSTGHTVITVQAGDTFARLDDNSFTLAPEAGGMGYQELIEALVADDRLPDRVLHTWLLTWDRSFRPGSSFFHRNQEYGFYSLLHLAQAFGKAGVLERKIHFIVAANGVQRVGAEPLTDADKATALGPCSVIPREFPNFTCRFIDIELPEIGNARGRGPTPQQRAQPAIDALEAEIVAPAATDVVSWRNGVRWQRHIGNWRNRDTSAPVQRVRERGVYLITGGLGGIAGVIADWLARDYRARLVLVARTPLPQRNDWNEWIAQNGNDDNTSRSIQRIRKLEALGAQVLALDADVTVAERMAAVRDEARQAFGEINGVFHAAGVIRDNLIQLKSQRDIEEVFSAKVYGTVVLDELFRASPLDFMVLFSSTSAFIAPQGQIDYVGANSFLNAFADSCRGNRPYPVTAVNWGIWQGVGMVGPASPKPDDVALQAQTAHSSASASTYPHFEQRLASRDGLQHVHLFSGTFSAERDWVIDEHRLGNGDALLPGTGYLELIRAAVAEVSHATSWQLSNLLFLNPLFVRNGEPRAFRVRLQGDEQRWDVDIFARKLGAMTEDAWDQCATARVSLTTPAANSIRIDDIEARCTASQTAAGGSSVLRTRQEDHLRFGPRWSVLKRLSLGKGEAIARLHLADTYATEIQQYGLHPALLDIATGCAMDLIPGYASHEIAQNLWAPISYRGMRFHAPLTADLVSWLRVTPDSSMATGFAAFDVTMCDSQGNVLVEVEQLTLRRIDGELRIPQTRDELPNAQEVASIPEKSRPRQASPAEAALQHNITQGIDPKRGVQALSRLLSSATMPSTLIVSSMELNALLRQADSISAASTATTDTRFTRPQLDSEFEAPRDDVEKALADIWGKLLGVEGVGIRDSFFDLGGHSLIAVRLFNEIADRFKVDLPMSVLMQSPTIASLGDIVRAESGVVGSTEGAATAGTESKPKSALQYRFVVPMHAGPVADRTPIFMVAGMFGNVLNLSHMAHLLGEERPFYALQARGLYGDTGPHESFTEAATDYIEEIRKVQPTGPYILGGFSGGGITAYEIARQLQAQGEEILQMIMLDTPLREVRTFSVVDRFSMFWQGLNAGGLKFFKNKFRERLEWERTKREKRLQAVTTTQDSDSLKFQSQRIGDAFLRALNNYKVTASDLRVDLFRPRLDVRFRLSRGRRVDSQRNYISEDNGWSPYISKLHVYEVPGNHDSMVLEPNVRVLVSLIRRAIKSAESAFFERTAVTAVEPARRIA